MAISYQCSLHPLLTSPRIPSGGITTFGPLIVKGFGFDSFHTILLNIPFGAVQIIATLGGAAFATWTKKKGPALALLCIPPIIGCVMLLSIEHTAAHRGPLLVAYYLVCLFSSQIIANSLTLFDLQISCYPGISKFPILLALIWFQKHNI
jgi:hypothetical protein